MTAPTIDHATFDALKELMGAEFTHDLVATFLQEAPPMLEDLRAAFAAGDAEKFRRAAHSLKTNGNTFGALTLGGMARELELAGLPAVRAAGAQRIDAVAAEYARVAAALTELRGA
jgi:HPt (histidine-containing phosphotransfer) domain-containing protein